MPIGHVSQYDRLPEIVKGAVTRAEFAWLSDGEKLRLIDDLTTPDINAEDGAW